MTGSPLGEPSHHGWLSAVSATLVKIVSWRIISYACGFVFGLVPGTTPKKPDSGLMACRRPSMVGWSQAMSSPTVHTFHPFCEAGGTSIAMLVLPQADGKAAAM